MGEAKNDAAEATTGIKAVNMGKLLLDGRAVSPPPHRDW